MRDIYTEPDADPDTLAHLGPLAPMAGVESAHGFDEHPVAGGTETASYVERYELEPIDPQANGPQLFYGLRYHLTIVQAEEAGTFHDPVGYWRCEPATGMVVQTLAIPRGQIAMAVGHAQPEATSFTVRAARQHGERDLLGPLLEEVFTTLSFTVTVTTHGPDSWSYDEQPVLQVLDRAEPSLHVDHKTLHRIGPPAPNLLMRTTS